MTAAVTERIINRLQPLSDDAEPVIMRFIASIEAERPKRTDIADSGLDFGDNITDENHDERMARAFALADDIEIDELAIKELREASMV